MNYGKNNTRKREHELASRRTMILKKFSVIFWKALLVCFFAVIVIGAGSGIGVIAGVIDSAPTIEDIDATPTGYLTTVLNAKGDQIATLVASGSNRKYVTIDEIPLDLQHAFVAIEDERFYEHNGIDIKGIIRAGISGIAAGFRFREGASTITQQLLKNTVFTGWTSESSMADKFERKFQEQYLALQLEKVVSKDWILENYLNAINMGQNTLGVGVSWGAECVGAVFRQGCLTADTLGMCGSRRHHPESHQTQSDLTPAEQCRAAPESSQQHAPA